MTASTHRPCPCCLHCRQDGKAAPVQGLCLPGGACLDLVWENGTLQTAALHAAAPWKMRLHCAGAEAEIELSARQSVTLNAALQPIH